ncbi:hypothetical protein EON81_05310 [bacterium]|nr:MAG: hypothetical protein EON81_05310 [bacterium]
MPSTSRDKSARSSPRVPKAGELWVSSGCCVRVKEADEHRTEFDNPSRMGPMSRCNTEWFVQHFEPA